MNTEFNELQKEYKKVKKELEYYRNTIKGWHKKIGLKLFKRKTLILMRRWCRG